MKVIFLDIDGVLNNYDSLQNGVQLHSDLVRRVSHVCQHTSAEIVISSTWRHLHPLGVLANMLWVTGLVYGRVIGKTPSCRNGFRGNEIEKYLCYNRHFQIDQYAILDDNSDFHNYQKPYFVQTHIEQGITDDDVVKLMDILGREDKYDVGFGVSTGIDGVQ